MSTDFDETPILFENGKRTPEHFDTYELLCRTREPVEYLAWTPEQQARWHERKREAEHKDAADKEERKRSAWREKLVEGGLPLKDLDLVTTGAPAMTKALQAAQEALRDRIGILVLSGTRGSGKTTAAGWWFAQRETKSTNPYIAERQRARRFIDAARLARWPRYDDERMEELELAAVLVVDDLGIEYDDSKGAFRSFIDAVVNARYANSLPTAITTNLSAIAFKERYGERIADRVREVGRFIEVNEPSLRGKR